MFIFNLIASIKTAIISAVQWCIQTVSNMIMTNIFGTPA